MSRFFDFLEHGGSVLPVVGGTLILVLLTVVWCCLEISGRHREREDEEKLLDAWRRKQDERIARRRGGW